MQSTPAPPRHPATPPPRHLATPSHRPAAPPGPGRGAVQTRLPWWALALPAVAFVLLLGLITTGGTAGAEGRDGAVGSGSGVPSATGEQSVGPGWTHLERVLERVTHALQG